METTADVLPAAAGHPVAVVHIRLRVLADVAAVA